MSHTYTHAGPVSGANTIPVTVVDWSMNAPRILVKAVTGRPFDIRQSQLCADYDTVPDRGAHFIYWSDALWINTDALQAAPVSAADVSCLSCGNTGKVITETEQDGLVIGWDKAPCPDCADSQPVAVAVMQSQLDTTLDLCGSTTDEDTAAEIAGQMVELHMAIERETGGLERVAPTPSICDIHGKIKGPRTEPQAETSREEAAHLGRYGY